MPYRRAPRITRRRFLTVGAVLAGAATAARFGGAASGAAAPELVFTTDQLIPLQEQEWARTSLLAGFTKTSGFRCGSSRKGTDRTSTG